LSDQPKVFSGNRPLKALGARAPSAFVLIYVGTLLFIPVVGALRQISMLDPSMEPSTSLRPFSVSSLLTTVWVCLLIGILSTLLGWPVAWVLRSNRRTGRVLGMLCPLPLLLPTFLAYTGWGMLRGPGTIVGDLLARQSPAVDVFVTRALAIGGLALWAWPLALGVLWLGVSRIPSSLIDVLRIEPASAFTRSFMTVRLVTGWVLASIGIIAAVMAGSAIPLHLAQVPTAAIHLWQYLALSTQPGEAWPAAIPLLLCAAVAAWLITRAIDGPALDTPESGMLTENRTGAQWWPWLLLGLSIGVPLIMFAAMIKDRGLILSFWSTSGRAVVHSLLIGAVVGALGSCVCVSVAAVRSLGSERTRQLLRVGLVLSLFGMFVPGILVGQAYLGLLSSGWLARLLVRSDLWIILAHLTRFGAVAWVAGWMLARQETLEERGVRILTCGTSFRGWCALRLVPAVPVVIGVGVALAALSLHEIESTVLLGRPGSGILAQRMLDLLHYANDEQLSAAGINVLGVSLLVALVAAWLLSKRQPGRQLALERDESKS
jgi:ABC-type Fe3+ transport system permease subunit